MLPDDNLGNRTGGLTACRVVPQTTPPPRDLPFMYLLYFCSICEVWLRIQQPRPEINITIMKKKLFLELFKLFNLIYSCSFPRLGPNILIRITEV